MIRHGRARATALRRWGAKGASSNTKLLTTLRGRCSIGEALDALGHRSNSLMLQAQELRIGCDVDQSRTDGGIIVADQRQARSRKCRMPCTAEVCHGFVISRAR
jgi:hypothetical protein